MRIGEPGPSDMALSNFAKLTIQVVQVDHLGYGSLVKLRRGSWELTAQQDPQSNWTEGQPVEIFLNFNRLHWFDFNSGKRLDLVSLS